MGNPESAEERADAGLSPTYRNYLAIIFREQASKGSARAGDIAEAAGVSRPTVSNALRALKTGGWIEYDPYGPVTLTARGYAKGRESYHRHQILLTFFEKILRIDNDTAQAAAAGIECDIPASVLYRLGQFVLYMEHRGALEGWLEDFKKNEDELLKHMRETSHAPASDSKGGR